MAPRESPRPRPRERDHEQYRESNRRPRSSNPRRKSRGHPPSSSSGSQALSADSLAKLNLLNERASREQEIKTTRTRPRRQREITDEKQSFIGRVRREHKRKRRRVVSGALLEEGQGRRLQGIRGGDKYEEPEGLDKRKKRICECCVLTTLVIYKLTSLRDCCSCHGCSTCHYHTRRCRRQ